MFFFESLGTEIVQLPKPSHDPLIYYNKIPKDCEDDKVLESYVFYCANVKHGGCWQFFAASRVQRISSQQAISLLSQWNSDSDTETDDDDSNDRQDDIQSSSASDLSSDSDDNSVPVTLLGTVGPSTTQHGRGWRPRWSTG